MNREEIKKEAFRNVLLNHRTADRTLSGLDLADFGCENFVQGAEWRINSAWHDANMERPERDRHYLATVEIPGKAPIIAIWKDDYRGQANHPFFKRWAYPEDFMPERKEETK